MASETAEEWMARLQQVTGVWDFRRAGSSLSAVKFEPAAATGLWGEGSSSATRSHQLATCISIKEGEWHSSKTYSINLLSLQDGQVPFTPGTTAGSYNIEVWHLSGNTSRTKSKNTTSLGVTECIWCAWDKHIPILYIYLPSNHDWEH